MSDCSFSRFSRFVFFFLFGLGVFCIHPLYFGLRSSALFFLKYTLLILKKRPNVTFIALIPKKSWAIDIKDFLPISLLGEVYNFFFTKF